MKSKNRGRTGLWGGEKRTKRRCLKCDCVIITTIHWRLCKNCRRGCGVDGYTVIGTGSQKFLGEGNRSTVGRG